MEKLSLYRMGARQEQKEQRRQEMLALSPEDEKEINNFIDAVALAESMTVPVEKPFDFMSPLEVFKLGMSMAAMGKFASMYVIDHFNIGINKNK